jgi:hypothetical protein
MRDVYKNPILYYLLIPVLVGLWPLLVWRVYLPRNQHQRDVEQSLLVEGQGHIVDILLLDPKKLDLVGSEAVAEEFSFGRATDRVANLCTIPAGSCTYSGGGIMKVSGKERQEGRSNRQCEYASANSFGFQSMRAGLTCEQAEFRKKKGMSDQWDVDFKFVYYY